MSPGGLGRGRSGAWASAGGVAVAVVLGREAPTHTPLAHVAASLLGRGTRGFPRGLDLSARLGLDLVPVAWNGPFDARGIEFPTDRVRSVDNYEGPAQCGGDRTGIGTDSSFHRYWVPNGPLCCSEADTPTVSSSNPHGLLRKRCSLAALLLR